MKNWQAASAVPVLVLILGATACSEKPAEKAAEKPRAAAPAAPAPQAAAPATQPATPSAQPATATPAGNPAAEKHLLHLQNYANTPIIVTLNGEWVGQWDAHNEVPLGSVQKGKNDLLVEVAGEAKGQITLYVQALRDNQRVNLLTLNFEGKPGKHAISFAAK